jgi:hypothetical protein
MASAESPAGFDTLAGPLPARLRAGPRPYLVISDIEVPADRVVTIESGAVFLFRNFTGLHVQGRLIADGTDGEPIVFTSEFDGDYNTTTTMLPNPYDWNGVYIHRGGIGTFLANCSVLYSVYGLISDTKFIRISRGTFRHNGKSDVVIEGSMRTVTDEGFEYSLSTKDALVDGVPVKILRDPLATRRTAVRYAGLSSLVGGLGLGVYSAIELRKSLDEFQQRSSRDTSNIVWYTAGDWEEARSRRTTGIVAVSGSVLACLLGGAGFAWSFTF